LECECKKYIRKLHLNLFQKNRFQKNMNFGKRFPKTIYEGKFGISGGGVGRNMGGGNRKIQE
jgi:hypothetical protein